MIRGALRRVGAALPALLPTALAFASHAPALEGRFLWLDHAHIEQRLAIAEPRAFASLFTQGFAETGYYRPLVALTLSIDAIFEEPWVFHVGNLLWHALASQALFALAQRIGSTRRAALAAACLFAVHPATSIVADAIAFRSESMALLAILLAVLGAARARPVLAGLAILGGALTKETALVLGPLFVLAYEGARARAEGLRPRLQKSAPLLVSIVVATLSALCLRLRYAPPFRATHSALDPSAAIGMRLSSFARLARAALVPAPSSVCDAVPIEGVGSRLSIAGVLVALGLIAVVVQRVRAAARPGGSAPLAVLYLALGVLPALQIVPVMRWWSIHYAYTPLAFALVVVCDAVGGLERLGDRAKGACVSLAVTALGVVSALDARRFHDDVTLFTPEVTGTDACREAFFYLAEDARARRSFALAAERYEIALADRPGYLAYVDRSAAVQNLGIARRNAGDLDGARAAFREGLAHAPSESARRALVHDLAAVSLEAGDARAAFDLLEPELARDDVASETLVVAAAAARALGFAATEHDLRERLDRRGWKDPRGDR
ncbi:MAG: hypothetical protein U0414_36100 [Polyangiaceae bacterium]